MWEVKGSTKELGGGRTCTFAEEGAMSLTFLPHTHSKMAPTHFNHNSPGECNLHARQDTRHQNHIRHTF